MVLVIRKPVRQKVMSVRPFFDLGGPVAPGLISVSSIFNGSSASKIPSEIEDTDP